VMTEGVEIERGGTIFFLRGNNSFSIVFFACFA